MGWFNCDYPGHEGYLVALVPADPRGARAAAKPDEPGKRRAWDRYVQGLGWPYRWRELQGGSAKKHDPDQPIRVFQVACDCGWRSRHFHAPLLGSRWLGWVELDEAAEDAATRVWQRHLEDEARAEVEELALTQGKKCHVRGCDQVLGHDGILGEHGRGPWPRRLAPVAKQHPPEDRPATIFCPPCGKQVQPAEYFACVAGRATMTTSPPSRRCSAAGRLRLPCERAARYLATGADGLQWFTCDQLEHQVEAVTLEEWALWYEANIARAVVR